MEDRDFIDFKFGDHWASDFNLLAVSSGDRYSPPVYGSVNPNTATIAGKVGVYKWKTQVNEKVFNIKIAFDNINGQILNQIKEWLNPFKIDKLVFKEEPYKYYWVALNTEPKLDFLPFLEETKVVNGIAFKEGVYKGEFELQFVCFDNYGYSDWQSFDENYDYVVKEIEGEESISFNDGSDNNLIITKIEGNSKQRTREEVTGTVINGSEMTINEEYISNKTQFVIDGNSEQKTYEGYQLINTDVEWLNSGATKSKINTGVRITVDVANVYRSSVYNMGGSELLGKTITLKTNMFFSGNNNGQIIAFFGNRNNNAISRVENSTISKSEKKVTFTIPSEFPSGADRVNLLFYGNYSGSAQVGDYVDYTDLIAYIGAEDKPYEPYTGGQPSPNPEYPQDIEVIDGVNLFPINEWYIPYSSGNLNLLIGNKSIFLKKGTYYLSFDFKNIGSPSFNTFVRWYSEEVTNIDVSKQVGYKSISTASSPAKIQFTLDNDYWVGIDDSQTKGGVEYKKIMLSKEDIPYLPHGCIGLEQSGKNKFDINSITKAYSFDGVDKTYSISINDGILICRYGLYGEGQYLPCNINNFKEGNVIISCDVYVPSTDTAKDIYLGYKSVSGWERKLIRLKNYDEWINISLEFSITNEIDVKGLIFQNSGSSSNYNNLEVKFKNIQVEYAETKSPYEPYHDPKLIPINLNGNSIAKVGDVKDLLRVYRNGDVEIEKKIGKVVLNGSENLEVHPDTTTTEFYYWLHENAFISVFDNCGDIVSFYGDGKNKTKCTHFVYEKKAEITDTGKYDIHNHQNVSWIYFSSKEASLDSFKSWLSTHNTEVYYQLATPEVVKLQSISPIELWEGTNNFKLITNLDTIMELTYNYLPAVPSVEEPSEIKNVTGNVNITVCNKNFFDINSVSEDVNGTLDKYETGIGATWRNFRYTNVLKIRTIKAGTYKICGKQTVSNTNSGDIVRFFYEDGTSVEIGIYNDYIPTTKIFTKDVVAMQLFINSNKSTGDYFRIDDFMLVSTDTTDVSYVEHQEQSFTFPLAEGQRLMKGDYLADDGIHHKRKQSVVNSDIMNTAPNGNKLLIYYPPNKTNKFNNILISSNAIFDKHPQFKSGTVYENLSNVVFVGTQEDTLETLQVKYNGSILEYELAEEEIEPYTTEQQIVYDEIKNNLYSYEGTNHIFSTDEVPPLLSISYVPKQDIYIDYVANQSNLLNDSAFYYNNDIYKKSYFDTETGDATKSGISENRPVYLYNAGTTAANLNLTFDMIIPAEGSPLVINTESCKLTDNGIQVLKQVSSISISDFSKYKPFLEIYDGTSSNWQIQIDSNLCEIYLKHKTDKTKIISLNKFNDNQSFLSLANCNFVDYSKPFPTLITAISGTALENTVFNKLSVGTSAQNYRLKNVDVKWKHTYL